MAWKGRGGEEEVTSCVDFGRSRSWGLKSRGDVPLHEFQISRFTRPNGILLFSCGHLLEHSAQPAFRIDLLSVVAKVLANIDKSFVLPLVRLVREWILLLLAAPAARASHSI